MLATYETRRVSGGVAVPRFEGPRERRVSRVPSLSDMSSNDSFCTSQNVELPISKPPKFPLKSILKKNEKDAKLALADMEATRREGDGTTKHRRRESETYARPAASEYVGAEPRERRDSAIAKGPRPSPPPTSEYVDTKCRTRRGRTSGEESRPSSQYERSRSQDAPDISYRYVPEGYRSTRREDHRRRSSRPDMSRKPWLDPHSHSERSRSHGVEKPQWPSDEPRRKKSHRDSMSGGDIAFAGVVGTLVLLTVSSTNKKKWFKDRYRRIEKYVHTRHVSVHDTDYRH